MSCSRQYGIAVYSKTPLEVTRSETAESALEVVSFYVGRHLVLALYCSPSKGTLQQLLELLFSAWHQRLAEADRVVIVGDFNVDLSNEENAKTRLLTKWMADHSFRLFPVGPTNDAGSCIDHVWHNGFIGGPNQTLDCHYSDHKNILVTLSLEEECL